MSLGQINSHTETAGSYRAGTVARTLQNRLAGTVLAAGLTSVLLVGVALSDSNFQASADLAKERIWNTVSALVCGSHLDAVSLVGPACGAAGR